jgi:hypothetical protein
MNIDGQNQTVKTRDNASPPPTQQLGGNDHRGVHGIPANPVPSQNPSNSQGTGQPRNKEEQEDIDAICRFFANGGGEESDDELVWANLTKSVSDVFINNLT